MIKEEEDPWLSPEKQKPSRTRFWKHPGTSAGTFGLVLFCFVLPFIHIKCSGFTVAHMNGISLATGSTPSALMEDPESTLLGYPFTHAPDYFVLFALLAATAGFGLAFIRSAAGSVSQLICASLGIVSLLLFMAEIWKPLHGEPNNYMAGLMKDSDLTITLQLGSGFWFSLALFVAAAMLAIIRMRK